MDVEEGEFEASPYQLSRKARSQSEVIGKTHGTMILRIHHSPSAGKCNQIFVHHTTGLASISDTRRFLIARDTLLTLSRGINVHQTTSWVSPVTISLLASDHSAHQHH